MRSISKTFSVELYSKYIQKHISAVLKDLNKVLLLMTNSDFKNNIENAKFNIFLWDDNNS